jgi:hypothetical protein
VLIAAANEGRWEKSDPGLPTAIQPAIGSGVPMGCGLPSLVAPAIAIPIIRIGSVVAVAIIRVAITVIATAISTAILSSPVADPFNGDITFRYRRQTSYTWHCRRRSIPANGAANYKYRCGHQAGEQDTRGSLLGFVRFFSLNP